MGTPKTLLQAILNGMCIGTAKESPETIKLHVRDFLAQKFSVATLKCKTDQEVELVQDLWFKVTGEKL